MRWPSLARYLEDRAGREEDAYLAGRLAEMRANNFGIESPVMTQSTAHALWLACCDGKEAFTWRTTAEADAYLCPFCALWHVGGPVSESQREILELAAKVLKPPRVTWHGVER